MPSAASSRDCPFVAPAGGVAEPGFNALGLLNDGQSRGAHIGKALGEIVGGSLLTLLGAGGEVGGISISASGIGALLGVPAVVVSGTMITGGVANVGAGVVGLKNALMSTGGSAGGTGAKAAVTYGDNATSKLRSHWGDIQRLAKEQGVQMPGKFKEAGPQIRSFIEDVVRLGETRVGPYKPTGGGWSNALWSKHGNAIVIRSPEGKFVTILDAAGGGAALNYPGGL